MAEELEGGLAHEWGVSLLSEAVLDSRQGASVLLGTVTVRADAPGLAEFSITEAELIDTTPSGDPDYGPFELTVDEFVEDMRALSTRVRGMPAAIFAARDGWPTNDVNEPSPEAFGIEGAGVPSAVSTPT